MKPLLFLDIDGVLNRDVSNSVARKRGLSSKSVWVDGSRYKINFDTDDKERLTKLKEYFDLAWGTTWKDKANTVFAPEFRLPLESLPYSTWEKGDGSIRYRESFYENKLPSILRLAGDKPFAWIDDIAGYETLLTEARSSAKFVATDPTIGLTDEIVDELIEWTRFLEVTS